MRKKIAAANWKMNCTLQEGEKLMDEILKSGIVLQEHQCSIFAVPYPYLINIQHQLTGQKNYFVAAQNCHQQKSGAYTGEVSAAMLASMQIPYCIIGHSERRMYNNETNAILAEKINLCYDNNITPIFCCGESLETRESGSQNDFVAEQITASLFHLPVEKIKTIIIAYEPIWAIGTGKTASTEQAQEMHQYIRSVLSDKYGKAVADDIPILYGGSVKPDNANELFACADVDGGLVGGASLKANDFTAIIKALPG